MNTNKDKSKPNPVLEEILKDDAPILEDAPDYVKPDEEDPNPTDPIDEEEKKDDDVNPDNEDEKKDDKKDDEPPELLTDAEKQLSEQRREAQLLAARNKKIADTIDLANNIPDPTLEELQKELKKELPDLEWEDLSAFEQSQFKKNFINSKKLSIIQEVNNGVREIEKWAEGVDKFIATNETSQKFKKLSGNEEGFRKFAMMESHRGIDMELLVNAYLNDIPATQKKNGNLFVRGGGLAPEKPPSDIIKDADQARKLKLADPRQYARKLREGKIKIELD